MIYCLPDSQYQNRHASMLRQKMLNTHDNQLTRIRNMTGPGGLAGGGLGAGNGIGVGAGGIALTEYNPNYEFGGGTCTLQDLKEIPRENLRLVK